MKVQCPECSARYKVDEKKLPAKGASVRCRKCQHKFFIKKEKPAVAAGETIECPRCKLPQKGIDKCEYCGFVFQEKSKTKKIPPAENLKNDNLTNCRFCKEPISIKAEICPHCKKIQINKKNMLWVGIGAFVLIFVFIIPYLTEHSKDRPKTEIKSTPKKVVSSDLNPKMKASIQKYVGDWIKTKRFIKSGFWDGSSLVQIFFELDVRYLGNNPKIEAEQFSDNVALQAVKIFKHDFCIHTYYGDHNKLSMSCEYFRD